MAPIAPCTNPFHAAGGCAAVAEAGEGRWKSGKARSRTREREEDLLFEGEEGQTTKLRL